MLRPNRHFSPFKLFLDRETQTALMLNPKVLTTFTRAWLAEGYQTHRGLADPSHGRWSFLSVPRRFPVAPIGDYLAFLRDPAAWDSFAFVRNPYARLASAWKNKFLDGHHRSPDGADQAYSRSTRQHVLQPLRAFARKRGLEGGSPNSLVPFETFLHFVAAQTEGQRDHHWDSQTTVLMCDRMNYERLFKIETERDAGFQLLGERLGFPAAWVAAKLEHRSNPSQRQSETYTPDLAALAHPIVASDLARFGYDHDSWRGLS